LRAPENERAFILIYHENYESIMTEAALNASADYETRHDITAIALLAPH
jgi:hypothetical protein